MNYDAVARSDTIKEVDLPDWGRAILEELLLKAAMLVSEGGAAADSVTVTLAFHLSAAEAAGCIEINMPGVVEKAIVTHLPIQA